MFIGLAMSGSAANTWISKPGGRWKVFCSCSGDSQGVVRTFSAKGSAAWIRSKVKRPIAKLGPAIRSKQDLGKRDFRFMLWGIT